MTVASVFDPHPLMKDDLALHTRIGLTTCGWTPTYRADPEQWRSDLTDLGYPSFAAWQQCMQLFGGLDVNPRSTFSNDTPYHVTADVGIVLNIITHYPRRVKFILDDPVIKRKSETWKSLLEQYVRSYQYAPIGVMGNVPLFIFSNGWIVSAAVYVSPPSEQKQYFFMVQGETIFHALNRYFHIGYVGEGPED